MNEFAAYSTMAMTLGLVVVRPRFGPRFRVTPALAALAGVMFLLAIGIVKPIHWVSAVKNLWSPFVAIGSIMVMTEVAARVGLLRWWAERVESQAQTTSKLFSWVFALGILTSSLLNNDAAILVLTPIVVSLVKARFPNRPAMIAPFAFAVFMSAGVAALPVSNPMNMVVADFSQIDFLTYVKHMLPVAVAGWLVAYLMLRLIFAKTLQEVSVPVARGEAQPATGPQRLMMVLLLAVLVAYPVFGFCGGPIWLVALGGAALSLGLLQSHERTNPAYVLVQGVSWETLVFLLAALVMSFGLRDVGLVDRLTSLYSQTGIGTIGVASAIGSAVLNNHPMSHLNMMALAPLGEGHNTSIFAALVGGDLGPRLLPMGSLAGLLWLEQLRRRGVEIRIGQFVKVGLLLVVPTIAISLTILAMT